MRYAWVVAGAVLTVGCAAAATAGGAATSAPSPPSATPRQVGSTGTLEFTAIASTAGTRVSYPVHPTSTDDLARSAPHTPIPTRPTALDQPGTPPLPTVSTDPCAGRPGRAFAGSIAEGAVGASTADRALSDFLAHPFEPGYPSPVARWHSTRIRDGIRYTLDDGSAQLSIVELPNHTWTVIGGRTCAR